MARCLTAYNGIQIILTYRSKQTCQIYCEYVTRSMVASYGKNSFSRQHRTRLTNGVQELKSQYSSSGRNTKGASHKVVLFLSIQFSEHLIVKIITLMTSLLKHRQNMHKQNLLAVRLYSEIEIIHCSFQGNKSNNN